jgi:heptaprenyl diphosphate synthase
MKTSDMKANPLFFLAFLSAIACSLHIVESLITRSLPLPFLRLGLSNVIILYLIVENKAWQAIIVNITKTLVSAVVTFTFLSPSTLISLGAGLAAVVMMVLAKKSRLGFSIYGVSICGATAHNMAQLIIAKWVVLDRSEVFVLTPILLLLGLVSGLLTAYIMQLFSHKIEEIQ